MTSSQDCHQALHRFIAKDFAAWTGLPASCDVATVASVLPLADGESRLVLGQGGHDTGCKLAKVDAYSEPVQVCYRGDAVVRIRAQFPALAEPAALLARLGPPAAKLDYYFSTMPVLNEQGEWVYADRGLTLLLSGDKENIVEVMVYPPTTVKRYMDELYYFEPPREFDMDS